MKIFVIVVIAGAALVALAGGAAYLGQERDLPHRIDMILIKDFPNNKVSVDAELIYHNDDGTSVGSFAFVSVPPLRTLSEAGYKECRASMLPTILSSLRAAAHASSKSSDSLATLVRDAIPYCRDLGGNIEINIIYDGSGHGYWLMRNNG